MEVKRELKIGYKQTEIGIIPEDWEGKIKTGFLFDESECEKQ